MDSSKKVFLISLLPMALTLVFIFYIVVPVIGNMNQCNKKLQSEKEWQVKTKSEIESLKEGSVLQRDVERMQNKLSDFDIRVPQTRETAVMLYDLERFSSPLGVKLISLDSKSESMVVLDESILKKTKNHKVNQKKKKSKKLQAANLYSIPIDIEVVGRYSNIVKFVSSLEKYQRMIVVDSLTLEKFKEDDKNPAPRVQATIKGSVFKFEVVSSEEALSDGSRK